MVQTIEGEAGFKSTRLFLFLLAPSEHLEADGRGNGSVMLSAATPAGRGAPSACQFVPLRFPFSFPGVPGDPGLETFSQKVGD